MGVPRQGTEQGTPFLPRERLGARDCMRSVCVGGTIAEERAAFWQKAGVITAWPMSEGYREKRLAPTVYGGGLRPEGTLP